MGIDVQAKLGAGLAFGDHEDDDRLDLRELARHLGLNPMAANGEDEIDDLDYEIEKRLPAGLKCYWHSSSDYRRFIIGPEPLSVNWGKELNVETLPSLTEGQRVELAKLHEKFGGRLGTWLTALMW